MTRKHVRKHSFAAGSDTASRGRDEFTSRGRAAKTRSWEADAMIIGEATALHACLWARMLTKRQSGSPSVRIKRIFNELAELDPETSGPAYTQKVRELLEAALSHEGGKHSGLLVTETNYANTVLDIVGNVIQRGGGNEYNGTLAALHHAASETMRSVTDTRRVTYRGLRDELNRVERLEAGVQFRGHKKRLPRGLAEIADLPAEIDRKRLEKKVGELKLRLREINSGFEGSGRHVGLMEATNRFCRAVGVRTTGFSD